MEVSVNFNKGEWITGPYKAYSETYPNTVWFGQLINKDASEQEVEMLINQFNDGLILSEESEREKLVAESIQYLVPGYGRHAIADIIIKPDEPNELIKSAAFILTTLSDSITTITLGHNDLDKQLEEVITPFSSVIILTDSPVDHSIIAQIEQAVHRTSKLARIGVMTLFGMESDLK